MDVPSLAVVENDKAGQVCMEPRFLESLGVSRARQAWFENTCPDPKLPRLRRKTPTVKEQLVRIRQIKAELELGRKESISRGKAAARSEPRLETAIPSRPPATLPPMPTLREHLPSSVLASFKTATNRLDSDLLDYIRQVCYFQL